MTFPGPSLRFYSTKAIGLTLVPVNEGYHRLSKIWLRHASIDLLRWDILSLSYGIPSFDALVVEKATLEELCKIVSHIVC